jgi:hypothetical protein
MRRTAKRIFACRVAAVVFLIASPRSCNGDVQPGVNADDGVGLQGRREG